MGALRRAWIGLTGQFAWRLRPAHMLRSFSRTEQGSALDMFAAVESTDRRDIRKKYFRHALDEWRHAGIFRERAREVAGPDAQESGREEAGVLVEHGIVGGRTLFERLGERDFLAFVFVAEADAVEQFGVYARHGLLDAGTEAALERILKDELFHVSYSKHELDRLSMGEGEAAARGAIRRVRWSRFKEGYLRLSRDLGQGMSTVWLLALYGLVLPPFRLLARLDAPGWRAPAPEARSAADALMSEA